MSYHYNRAEARQRAVALAHALEWALEEIDVLSGALTALPYPEGVEGCAAALVRSPGAAAEAVERYTRARTMVAELRREGVSP